MALLDNPDLFHGSDRLCVSLRTDQLLADIDDMLSNLSMHLDFMIPGSS